MPRKRKDDKGVRAIDIIKIRENRDILVQMYAIDYLSTWEIGLELNCSSGTVEIMLGCLGYPYEPNLEERVLGLRSKVAELQARRNTKPEVHDGW